LKIILVNILILVVAILKQTCEACAEHKILEIVCRGGDGKLGI
jgi:hypothetical protein